MGIRKKPAKKLNRERGKKRGKPPSSGDSRGHFNKKSAPQILLSWWDQGGGRGFQKNQVCSLSQP